MAQDYVDESNPFGRSGDEVELYRHFGSGGRTIEIKEETGVAEGQGVTAMKGPHGSLNTKDPLDGASET